MSKNTNKGAGFIETLVVFLFIGAGIVLLKVLRTGTNQEAGDQDTIFELSKKISSEMVIVRLIYHMIVGYYKILFL